MSERVESRILSTSELAKHESKEDLWIAIDGKVYDMTSYLSSHPGGVAMLRQAGKDGTQGFMSISAHSTVRGFINNILQDRLVGSLEQPDIDDAKSSSNP